MFVFIEREYTKLVFEISFEHFLKTWLQLASFAVNVQIVRGILTQIAPWQILHMLANTQGMLFNAGTSHLRVRQNLIVQECEVVREWPYANNTFLNAKCILTYDGCCPEHKNLILIVCKFWSDILCQSICRFRLETWWFPSLCPQHDRMAHKDKCFWPTVPSTSTAVSERSWVHTLLLMVLARDNESNSFYAAMSAQEHDLKKKGGGGMESKGVRIIENVRVRARKDRIWNDMEKGKDGFRCSVDKNISGEMTEPKGEFWRRKMQV